MGGHGARGRMAGAEELQDGSRTVLSMGGDALPCSWRNRGRAREKTLPPPPQKKEGVTLEILHGFKDKLPSCPSFARFHMRSKVW